MIDLLAIPFVTTFVSLHRRKILEFALDRVDRVRD